MSSDNGLAALPVDLLHALALQLPVRDVGRLARVCRATAAALREDYLWRGLIQRDFGVEATTDDARKEYRLMGQRVPFDAASGQRDNRFRLRSLPSGRRVIRIGDSSYQRMYSSDPFVAGIHYADVLNLRASAGNTMIGIATSQAAAHTHPGESGTYVVCFGSGDLWNSLPQEARLAKEWTRFSFEQSETVGRRFLCVLDQSDHEADFVYFGMSDPLPCEFDANQSETSDVGDWTTLRGFAWVRSQAIAKGPKWLLMALYNEHDAVDELPSPTLPESFFALRARAAHADRNKHCRLTISAPQPLVAPPSPAPARGRARSTDAPPRARRSPRGRGAVAPPRGRGAAAPPRGRGRGSYSKQA